MAQARKAQVIITANASVAERVMQELEGAATRAANRMKSLTDTAAPLKERMKQLAAEGKKDSDEFRRLNEQVKQLDKEYKVAEKDFQAFNSRMRENVKDTKRVEETMKQLATTATRDLRRAFQAAKRELEKMSEKDPRRQQLIQDMKKIQQQIDTNTGAIKKQQGAWGALGTTMKNLFAYAGIFAAFNRLKGLFEDVIQKNREMSDQLANIRKVSGLAMEDINGLTKSLAKIDTRTSIKGLNDLAYVGAKLGFGNMGTEALESFVKSALKVENALKEDLGEDSMMAISKLVEVMGLIPKMGVEKAMDSAGSAIFKLASTSTATGANIIEFSKRLMGLANVSHITTDQLLALGSASDAMGLMPEVSATAFNKVFTSIQSNTKAIETSLQMQKGELTELINQGKTMEAIVTVFDKMHGMNMDELKAKGVFKALGSDGARLNNVMITMSDRIDMLKTHLKTSNQAFSEGSAVAQEYAIQMETAEAYYQRAANMWQKAFVNPEGVDLTKEFAKAWYDLSKALTQTEGNATAIKIIMESIFGIMKLLVELLPAIITGFATWGMWAGGAFLIKQLKELFTMLTAIGTGVRSISWAGLAGVITGVAMGTYILFQKFRELNGELQKTRPYMDGFKKDLSDLNTQFGAATQELDRYKRAIDSSVSGTKQRAAAIAEFNNKFGGYLKNMLTEESSAYAIAKAYEAVTKALRAKMALQLKEKDISEQVMPREQWTAERREEYAKSVQGTQFSQYGRDWITAFAEENKGRKLGDIGKDLAKMFGITAKEVANMIPNLTKDQSMFKNLYTDQQWMVRNALRYIAQDRSARNAKIKVDEKWAPEQKAIDDYLASQTPKETPITPIDGDRLTKEELSELKKQQQEAKQAMRKDLKDAQEASTGIISKLEEYYRLQETAISEARADGKLTEDQTKEMVRSLNIFKNESLATARRAITTGETEDWDKLKTTILPAVMSDTSEVSRTLLDTIQKVVVEKLHDDLAKFNGSEGVFGLSSRAFFDQMRAKAAGNEREAARLRAKIQNEVEKALLQYQFVEKANQQMRKDVENMGITTETYEQWAKRMQQGIEEKPDTRVAMGQNARDEILQQFKWDWEQRMQQPARTFNGEWNPASFPFNSDNEEQVQEWFRQFVTNAKWTSGIPKLEEWLKDGEKYKAEIRKFYESLILIQESSMQKSESVSPMAPVDETWMKRGQQGLDDLFSYSISDEQAYRQMGNKFMDMGVINFRYNIDNEEEARQWVKQFATDARGDLEGWAQAFPQLSEWIDIIKRKEQGETLGEAEQKALEEAMPAIRNLFDEMMRHADRLNKAMKDAFQHEKEQQESRFRIAGYKDQEEQTDKVYSNQAKQQETGAGQNFAQMLGLGSIANDPEILQIQNRIYWRQKEVEDARQRLDAMKAMQDEEMEKLRETAASKAELDALEQQHAQDRAGLEQLLMDRQTALTEQTTALTTQTMQELQKRSQAILKLSKPFTDAANSIGKKLGDMIRGAEEDSITWEEIWKNMALAVGEAMIEMGAQYLQNLIMQQSINRASEAEEAAHVATEVPMGIAAGSAKTIGQLGWWGIPLVAVISALLMGLLQAALSTNRNNNSATAAKPKVKLASGMLTYDEGNVQTVVGDDGRVYRAKEQRSLPEGVSMVTEPIATRVNGQAALVGERGPEIVIGRRTTRAIQMNRPDLLRDLALIDRGITTRKVRTFDEGNISDMATAFAGQLPAPQQGQQGSEDSPEMRQTLDSLSQTVTALSATVLQLQKNGIPAKIQKYGTGGLIDEVQSGLKFVSKYK